MVRGSASSVPRGIRNANPLNLRDTGQGWVGEVGADPDGFLVFESPFYGIRAAARVLQTYAARGVVAVRDIVETWAPPSENDSDAYVDHVAAVLGMLPDDPVRASDYPALLSVMIRHENGQQPYSVDLIRQAVAAA